MTVSQHLIAMGYIKGVFGIKGWLRVKTDTEYADGLLDYEHWYLSKDGEILQVTVESGKVIGDELQVKFTHIHDREAAALLRGYTVEIPREAFSPVEADEYYWVDLIGMSVINVDGEALGIITNLMQTGAHDVLVVEGDYGQKLIPFVAHYIESVDKETRIVVTDWGIDY